MKQKFAPSLMAMDLMNVQEQIEGLNPYAYYYHVDVIDWHYARNMCLSPQFIEQLRKITETPLDVHLMVQKAVHFQHITFFNLSILANSIFQYLHTFLPCFP